ncbi:unnamed protein product [Adineta steineri]|uniref:Sulfotransferase n=1 Tax=Adineta steineri TaxID=433720 RepID=A0A819DL58_9BILA|nr:unnamed protein product [Adineta steineri]CAF3831350.1 unnamed protein product [Adineta steineri]
MEGAAQDNMSKQVAKTVDTSIVLRTEINLNEDNLSEEAKKQFSDHSEILCAYQLNAHVILANNRLSPIGRHLYCLTLERNYSNYKNVLNYVANHPELKITTQSLQPPLILCGLARTGTTLLYNLLACDPACRAPFAMDMMDPVPPLARSDTSREMHCNKLASTYSDMLNTLGLNDYQRELHASHPSFTHDEDLFVLSQAGLNWPTYLLASHRENEFAKWFLNDANKDFIYQYHKTFIQMLNSVDAPRSRWLFKTAIHALYFNTLLKYYPTASLIMTHRRLDEALPSCARLAIAYANAYFDNNKADVRIDKKMVVEQLLNVYDVIIRRIVEFRRTNRDVPVLDIFYDDLLAQPIDTVRRIYQHFNMTWSEDFEQAMLKWLRDNPQGKQGRNTYTLEEFGLDRETIDKNYEEYNNMFLKTRDQSETDANRIKN